ncbi:Cdh1p KNAG_0B05550 [Huiozyma naganishii CBS 8797]|uniref:CDC20/Fizzy WD40 domain-containing protein n=1 Tax=Huiozyma naganishii (strain ATCC MYA-139 / BCRC 22969 / CBS 8797 / KCTC 17520 / NBRC 10181 / NCYC 3082 / Yp74L-3) TaxID=1071383 RepID=J7RHI2_HUIN7|nr:hypothetical protein KNAG_0B05550 [Kazachstania naganishii CBS 8797]CCK68988.1 hypothetical protein KNAG_0B05550 [Kazachstania naganishii CBS 8797]
MSRQLGNPFMNNTPKPSPLKGKDERLHSSKVTKRSAAATGSTPSSSVSTVSGSLTNPLLLSPTRRPRTTGGSVYTDRFIPSRTETGINSIKSISSSQSMPFLPSTSTEDQLESQRERQAHKTFDAVLKNEIFGEMLSRDSMDSESNTIDKIKHTRATEVREPMTPSPERRRQSGSNGGSTVPADNNSQRGVPAAGSDGGNDGSRSHSNIDSVSAPVTPRRLFPNATAEDHLFKPSSNSTRGASIFTYRDKSSASKRPSTTASFMKSAQFMDSKSPVRPDSKQLLLSSPGKSFRKITKVPYRVLDAPSLADDFYYDLIDWSSKDMLAVALNKSIFLTNNATGDVVHLCDTDTVDNEFTSLSWVGAGSHLAVGQRNGLVEIYDAVKGKCIRTLSGHVDRVACLSWNNHILSSGSRDHRILHRDVRMPDPFFERIESHTQEVCGLKWNVDENKLASGGNDNIVHVYDGTSRTPMLTLNEHKAAVKAIAWSPHKRGILATGGGTADRCLKIWNINNLTKVREVDTSSQICNMLWSKNTDEIVTSHGYSKYNLTLWDYPTLSPVAILKGHSFRVLHLTLSTDGTTVVSGAGDETLRYWNLFEKQKPKSLPDSSIFSTYNQIR